MEGLRQNRNMITSIICMHSVRATPAHHIPQLFWRQGLGRKPWLASSLWSSCLSLPCDRITDLYHNAWLKQFPENIHLSWDKNIQAVSRNRVLWTPLLGVSAKGGWDFLCWQSNIWEECQEKERQAQQKVLPRQTCVSRDIRTKRVSSAAVDACLTNIRPGSLHTDSLESSPIDPGESWAKYELSHVGFLWGRIWHKVSILLSVSGAGLSALSWAIST